MTSCYYHFTCLKTKRVSHPCLGFPNIVYGGNRLNWDDRTTFRRIPFSIRSWVSIDHQRNFVQDMEMREFPGGPVVRTRRFHCQGSGSIPGQGTKIPQAARPKKKKKKLEARRKAADIFLCSEGWSRAAGQWVLTRTVAIFALFCANYLRSSLGKGTSLLQTSPTESRLAVGRDRCMSSLYYLLFTPSLADP